MNYLVEVNADSLAQAAGLVLVEIENPKGKKFGKYFRSYWI